MFFLKDLPTQAMLEGYSARFAGMAPEAVAEALARLRWASLLLRDLEAYFAQHGLGQTQFLVLMVIDREPERETLLPSEIADRLDISRPIVSNVTRRLIEQGLLTQTTTRGDARTRPLKLTEAGADRLSALLPGYFDLLRDRVAASTP
ncbi:MAG: MarR family transcriptional regulator [Pseudomonadota bacterium]